MHLLMKPAWEGSAILELDHVSCERDDRLLFKDLSQTVEGGDILQVQGPNGSGKTTLLRILTGISTDYRGRLTWCGQPISQNSFDYHRNLLYIGHLPAVKRSLTPEENLGWYCGMNNGVGLDLISRALAEVGLAGYEDVPSHRLSAGQLRRVALARLYLSPARVWILDEPFTAIDVQGVAKLRELFSSHARAGGILILTTHQDLGIEQVKLLNLLDYSGEQIWPR
jgi:heme exporter protein A